MPQGRAEPHERLIAWVIDAILLLPAPLAVGAAIDSGFSGRSLLWVIPSMALVVGVLATDFWLIAARGQTIGKRIVGIRVVRSWGNDVGFWRYVLIRTLPINIVALIPVVGLFLFLIDVLFVFNRDRRCLHDYIADTIVVRDGT